MLPNFRDDHSNDLSTWLVWYDPIKKKFRAVGQTQAELHNLKIWKIECVYKTHFANPVTY